VPAPGKSQATAVAYGSRAVDRADMALQNVRADESPTTLWHSICIENRLQLDMPMAAAAQVLRGAGMRNMETVPNLAGLLLKDGRSLWLVTTRETAELTHCEVLSI
jgi:hypothetical protein